MKDLRRTTTLGAVLVALASVGIFAAPAAHAQLGVPTTDDVTNVIDDTTDTVTGTVGDGVGETVEETVEDPGSLPDRVTDTVDDIVEDVPDDPVTGPVKDVVKDVGNTIDDAAGGTGSPPLPGKNGGRDNGSRDSRDRRDGDRDRSDGSDRVLGNGTATGVSTHRLSPDGFVGTLTLDSSAGGDTVRLDAADPSFGERAARIAVEAAKRLAFPMLLLALVFMFLAFHGRVGRKDPKLALAAVDHEHNFLDFE